MSRDRPDDSGPAIDEPAGDETVIAGPRARRKPKFIESSSGLQTAIYTAEGNDRPPTVPEGTDEIALDQPDVTDTTVQTGMTLDPSQRARVLDVHNKAERLLAELDATANIKIPKNAVNPVAKTEPADLDDDDPATTVEVLDEAFDDFDDDDDDSLEENETIVDPRALKKPHYPTPMPAMAAHTPAPGTIPGAGAVVAHTPIPGAVSSQSLDPERDDDADLMTLETGWSPVGHSPVAPRAMPAAPPRRSVGSVLLAPFRAIASLFRPPQPRSDAPELDDSSKLQTYTQVNRMVQRRRQHPTSSPPPRDGDGDDRG